jgi:endonuclease/exonuclease/phosphatase (EEP) superfamily protein YafD
MTKLFTVNIGIPFPKEPKMFRKRTVKVSAYQNQNPLNSLISLDNNMVSKRLSPRSILSNFVSFVTLGSIVSITGLALVSSRYGWKIYLEIFSHFQVQYFVLALLLFVILWFTRRKPFILIGLLCCTTLATQVVLWYIPPKQFLSTPPANVRILVANINTKNQSYSKVMSLVRREQPDLAIFMEVDNRWVEQLNSLHDLLPHSFGQANPYNLGLVVYSQQALTNPQVHFFGTEKNASVTGQFVVNGKSFLLLATHPLPPAKPSFFQSRNQQLDLISQYLKTTSLPVVMVGDLNLTMWSPYYRRLVNQTGLKNARQGFGILPTWPTQGSYNGLPAVATSLLAIPIDHCLLSPDLEVSHIRVGAETGSDHRPLIVDLHL